MISIPDEFFKEEVRDGYLVSEIMKRSWASQMTLLQRLKELLDKYGLKYYAECGTLLGAVRHGGYIPWDDDLDISMSRRDFMTLIEHADEIGDDLVIRSVYNSDTYINCHAVITHKADILKWDEKRYLGYHKCPFICYVDIFPWDYVPLDPEMFKIYKLLYIFAYKMTQDCRSLEEGVFGGKLVTLETLQKNVSENGDAKKVAAFLKDYKDMKDLFQRYSRWGKGIDKDSPLRRQLFLLSERTAQMCSESEAREIGYGPDLAISAMRRTRDKEWFKELVELPFEYTTISAPKDYERVLSCQYGNDYMTPERGMASHGYPFFRDEVRVLMDGDVGDDFVYANDVSEADIPGEWKELLLDANGSLRKLVMYVLSGTDVMNGGSRAIKEIRRFLKEQTDRGDTVVICFVSDALLGFMEKCELSLATQYREVLEEIAGMDSVILDTKPGPRLVQAVMMLCDECYGDESRMLKLCEEFGVPVTRQVYQ